MAARGPPAGQATAIPRDGKATALPTPNHPLVQNRIDGQMVPFGLVRTVTCSLVSKLADELLAVENVVNRTEDVPRACARSPPPHAEIAGLLPAAGGIAGT